MLLSYSCHFYRYLQEWSTCSYSPKGLGQQENPIKHFTKYTETLGIGHLVQESPPK